MRVGVERIKENGVPRALQRRRLLERLHLLCACGVGLEAIAAPVTKISRDLIGAESGSIFWMGGESAALGFYHDSAPVEIKDFFVANFDTLFSNPDEPSMVSLIAGGGPPIGNFLSRKGLDRFRQSAVFRHLCAPLGHSHVLDVRIDRQDRGLGVLCLWNGDERPFTARDAMAMEPVRQQLGLAVRSADGSPHWRSTSARTMHLITDAAGTELLSIDPECEQVLAEAHLLRQRIPMLGGMSMAPGFCADLADRLRRGEPAELDLPIANGRLHLTAAPGRMRENGTKRSYLMVAIDRQEPLEVRAVELLCALPLTLLQKRLALFAMQGGKRVDCEERFGVRAEALKKHLRTVYDATGVGSWSELREIFLRPDRRADSRDNQALMGRVGQAAAISRPS